MNFDDENDDDNILDLDLDLPYKSDKDGLTELKNKKKEWIEELMTNNDESNTMADMLASPIHEPSFSKYNKRPALWNDTSEFVPEINPSGSTILKKTDDNVISYIPDIDEIETDNIISELPTVVPKLISLQELENDINENKELTTFDGIDLSILTQRLIPKHHLIEEDIPWTWDNLIGELSLALDSNDIMDNFSHEKTDNCK